jgi:hypothetical protein
MNPLLTLGIFASLMLGYNFINQKKTVANLTTLLPTQKSQLIPKALHAVLLATQFYELILVVEHASIVTISSALFLLAILSANRQGTEEFAVNTKAHSSSGKTHKSF